MRTLRRWWHRLIGTQKYEELIFKLRRDLDAISSAYAREKRARAAAESARAERTVEAIRALVRAVERGGAPRFSSLSLPNAAFDDTARGIRDMGGVYPGAALWPLKAMSVCGLSVKQCPRIEDGSFLVKLEREGPR